MDAALIASSSSNTLGTSDRSGFDIQCEDDQPTPGNSSELPPQETNGNPKLCLRMQRAALEGDWSEAEKIIREDKEIVRRKITDAGSYTALHVAAGAGQVRFVEELVKNMENNDLELTDKKENTAFCVAAAAGSLEIAKIMIRKYPKVSTLPGSQGRTALYFAALFGHQKMTAYLYCPLQGEDQRKELFFTCIKSGLYGLALVMLKKNPKFASGRDKDQKTALHLLAVKPSAFTSKPGQGICKRLTKCFIPTILKISAELKVELAGKNLEFSTLLDLLAHARSSRRKEQTRNETSPSILPTIVTNCYASSVPHGQPLWHKIQRYVVLKIIEAYPELFLHPNHLKDALNAQDATSASRDLRKVFEQSENSAHALLKDLWDQVMNTHLKQGYTDQKFIDILTNPTHLLFDAAESGNSKFVAQLIYDFPDLIWETTGEPRKWSIIHAAVNNRNERIFSLVYEIGLIKNVITTFRDQENGNTLLHLAAKLAPVRELNKLPGAAFQMQRELLWFEEVKKIMQPSYIQMKNNSSPDGMTAQDSFSNEHADLLKAGQKWMKGTAGSCTIVSTLIASALFAAIVSVSLGQRPLKTTSFRIFIISDAIACLLALMSTLTFMAILTSRYAERDFLVDLPRKLKFGLTLLLLSIIAMMVAFSSAILIGYGMKDAVFILASLFALLTGLVSVVQQRQLLSIVFGSASSADSLFKVSDLVHISSKESYIRTKEARKKKESFFNRSSTRN